MLPGKFVNALSIALFVTSLGLIQVLIGGTRLLFSLPAYGLLGLAGVLTLFAIRRRRPTPDQVCLASSVLFFGYLLGRAFLSPDAYLARTDIYSVLGTLLVYLFAACILTDAKPRMLVLISLFVLAMAHVVVGAIQFTEGNNFMPIAFLQRFDYGRRASGFYVCPNHLAGLLEILGVFGVSIACWSRSPMWGKLLVAYAAGVCYLGVVLSGSRTGYLSTIVSLLVFGLLSLTVLRRASAKVFLRVGVPLVLAAVVIGALVVSTIHKSDYLSARADNVLGQDLNDPSAALRADLRGAAVQQWRLQPVFGTGSGTYLYYGRLFRSERVEGDPTHVHNDYLELLAEYGAAGAVSLLLFLALHLRHGWQTFQRLGPRRIGASPSPALRSNGLALNLGALAAVSAAAVHSLFDFSLHIPANALLLAFVFGILANGGRQRGGELRQPAMSIMGWRLLLPAIGAVVAVQSVRLLPGEYFAERSRTALRDLYAADSALLALEGLNHERSNPNLHYYLGRSLALQGGAAQDPLMRDRFLETALVELQKAHNLAPLDEVLFIQIARVYDAMGRFAEGEWMYQEAMALDPKSWVLRKMYQAHLRHWQESGKHSSLSAGFSRITA